MPTNFPLVVDTSVPSPGVAYTDIQTAIYVLQEFFDQPSFCVQQGSDPALPVQEWKDLQGVTFARFDTTGSFDLDYPADGTIVRHIGFGSGYESGAVTRFQWSVSDAYENKPYCRPRLLHTWGLEVYGNCGAPWNGPMPDWIPGSTSDPCMTVVGTHPSAPVFSIQAAPMQTGPLLQTASFQINADGSLTLAKLDDEASASGTFYVSRTTGKPTYKGSDGILHVLD